MTINKIGSHSTNKMHSKIATSMRLLKCETLKVLFYQIT